MGRWSRNSVASVTGYSLNSTSGSSFRELDDVFLQKQTRIWLGEVLGTRLDEGLDISDLLADGELLRKVSEVLWNLLLTKCGELWHLKANLKGPTASRKTGGRYKPYSNVDSFLKICKIFGLNGIDLFSPTDVVEKKDTRKVCICIRALSKKARSKQLHLPDFDIVTNTVAMSTDMVECLRKSLESPQSTISSSSTYNSYELSSRSKLKQAKKLLISGDVKNNDVSSEESDEAETNFRGADCHYSSTDKLETADVLNSDLENSPGAYSSTKTEKDVAGEISLPRDYEARKLSFSSIKPSVSHSRDDDVGDNMSFLNRNYRRSLNDRENGGTLHAQINSARDIDLSLQKEYLAPDKLHYSTEERDYISEYLAFSDSVVLGTECGSPILFDGEESTYNFFMGIDARGSNLKGGDSETGSQRRDSDVEDEVSSTTSMSSILGRMLAMEFDDRYDLDDISTMKDRPDRYQDNKAEEYLAKGTMGSFEIEGMEECETITDFTRDAKEHILATKGENFGHDALPSTVEPTYIQMQSDSHKGQGKDFQSNDIEHDGESNEKCMLSEDTSSIGSNTIGSEFSYNQHSSAQYLVDKPSDLSAMRLENLRCSSHKISVEDSKNCYCHSYSGDEITHHIESQGEPDGRNMSPENVGHDNFDIYLVGCVSPQELVTEHLELSSTKLDNCHLNQKDEDIGESKIYGEPDDQKSSPRTVGHDKFGINPAGCVSPQEVYQSSTKLVDTASISDHQACPSVEKDTDFAQFTNQDCKKSAEEDVSECKGDTNSEHSHIKPRRKLINRVAKGTAVVGVLFFLFNLSKRVGVENGKLGKTSFQMKNYTYSKSTKQTGNQGSKVTGTYPAEKFKI